MDSMYETILSLPLFKGATFNRISEIVGSTKMHFLKYSPGETLLRAGDRCTHVKFILSGAVRMVINSADERFRIGQTLSAPEVIAPDFLFGRATQYPGDVTSLETTSIMQIEKQDYVEILHSDRVFLYNFLNLLSRNAQKSIDGILAVSTGSLAERIAYWIMALTQPGSTDIRLACRQRDLYSIFGVSRPYFVSALEELRDNGLIEFSSTEIVVKSRPGLMDLLTHPSEV